MSPEFLDFEDVVDIHRRQLGEFGGLDGARDAALLDSALAQPMAAFGGQFLHEDLFAMAAAYLFHIVANHPFNDDNKRTGLVAALTFLDLNGHPIGQPSPLLYDASMAVAAGQLGKEGVAALLRSLGAS